MGREPPHIAPPLLAIAIATLATLPVALATRREGTRLIITVTDQGPGIPESDLARVFERFYRVLGTKAQGSGLGLAIVREIAQQHGADVDIFHNPRSTEPRWPGSLFRLSFPHHQEPA